MEVSLSDALMALVGVALLILTAAVVWGVSKVMRRADAFTNDKGELRIPKVDIKDVKGLAAYMGLIKVGLPLFDIVAGKLSQWAFASQKGATIPAEFSTTTPDFLLDPILPGGPK